MELDTLSLNTSLFTVHWSPLLLLLSLLFFTLGSPLLLLSPAMGLLAAAANGVSVLGFLVMMTLREVVVDVVG